MVLVMNLPCFRVRSLIFYIVLDLNLIREVAYLVGYSLEKLKAWSR